MSALWLSLTLGLVAGLADYLGGFLLVRRSPSARALRYFVALGAGFMLAAAVLEMIPEGMQVNPRFAPLLILAGYCGVHLLEHSLVPHFHFGEETHHHEFLSAKTSYSVLLGLATHTFFDGVAIASGFLVSRPLGFVLFWAVLLHKLPEGFAVGSLMLASGASRRAAVMASVVLGLATMAGVVFLNVFSGIVGPALALSAGATIYVAASDLIPEVNKERSWGVALAVFGGVLLYYVAEHALEAAGLHCH